MPVTINGNGSITGLSVGGLGTGIVNTATLANNAATQAKRAYATGEIVQIKYQVQGTGDFGMNSTNETDATGMTIDFALSDASNNILVEFTYAPYMGGSGGSQYKIRGYRDSTQLYQNAQGFYRTNDDFKCAKVNRQKFTHFPVPEDFCLNEMKSIYVNIIGLFADADIKIENLTKEYKDDLKLKNKDIFTESANLGILFQREKKGTHDSIKQFPVQNLLGEPYDENNYSVFAPAFLRNSTNNYNFDIFRW